MEIQSLKQQLSAHLAAQDAGSASDGGDDIRMTRRLLQVVEQRLRQRLEEAQAKSAADEVS